jgi:hypothetical protein
MFIKSEQDYNKFLNENSVGRCILHVVGNNDEFHGACNHPLVLFVKNVDTDSVYIVNIGHYDEPFTIPKDKLIADLNNIYCTKFVVDKKRFLHILPIFNLKDLQLIDFIENGSIDDTEYRSSGYRFYYTKFKDYKHVNNAIPLAIHSQIFENLCKIYEDSIENFKEDDSYKSINDNIIEALQQIEHNGLYVNQDTFNQQFSDKNVTPVNDYVFTEYNIYTSTGRPSNRFGGINYAALNKDNGCRASFVSRHGEDGMLLLIDYSAYHPHIVARLINYELPKDAYAYLGKYYYGKDELTPEEIKTAKNTTFQCMYGNIPNELLEIPYFKKMSEYIKHRWEFFNENGYVETPLFKRRITNKHILDPNPNKLFNYILQASETEFGIRVLSDINTFLKDKKTKPVIYTYDSLLYDICKDDGKQTLLEIKKIMSSADFPVKCYLGHDYNRMIAINI